MMYVHKMSKNAVVESVVGTVVSRNKRKDWKSEQLSVPGTIDRALLTSTITMNIQASTFSVSSDSTDGVLKMIIMSRKSKTSILAAERKANCHIIWHHMQYKSPNEHSCYTTHE